MEPRRNFKIEERNEILVRSQTSESDISEDIAEDVPISRGTYSDLLNKSTVKMMRM